MFLGIPSVIYLTLNSTIRNETRKFLLKLLCVNVENLRHQTLIELNVTPIQNYNSEEGRIEQDVCRWQVTKSFQRSQFKTNILINNVSVVTDMQIRPICKSDVNRTVNLKITNCSIFDYKIDLKTSKMHFKTSRIDLKMSKMDFKSI